jgi:hypothetical protein
VEFLIDLLVDVLRLIPLILAYYIPAMLALIIWRERSPGWRIKIPAILLLGFGFIAGVKLVFQPGVEVSVLALVSAVQISAALFFAYLTVYKLAD